MTGHIPVERFVNVALAYIEALSTRIPLKSAVLDRWGGAVRVVYGCDCVERCVSSCEDCELHALVGEDVGPAAPDEFRPSLRRATPKQLKTFSARQRMMNCKTADQYADAFVEWLVYRCPDRPSLEAETALVLGFRLLLKDGRPATAVDERELRRRIVSGVVNHPRMDGVRRNIVEELLAGREL